MKINVISICLDILKYSQKRVKNLINPKFDKLLGKPRKITHIKQFYKVLKDKKEFHIKTKKGYQVIDYTYATPDTFRHPLLLECRGIKFDLKGNLIARPLHKFFNLFELPTADKIIERINNGKENYRLIEKLDGSMIHTCYVEGKLRLFTIAGDSDIASYVESEFLKNKNYLDLCEHVEKNLKSTAIFEYISPSNRIYIKYKKEELVLLGVRHRTYGNYLSEDSLHGLSCKFGVPLAIENKFNVVWHSNFRECVLDPLSKDTNSEGAIMIMDSGERIKLKTEDYCKNSKASWMILYRDPRKVVLPLILNNTLDDYLKDFDEEIKSKVLDFQARVFEDLHDITKNILDFVNRNKDVAPKDLKNQKGFSDLQRYQFVVYRVHKDSSLCVLEELITYVKDKNTEERIDTQFKESL